MLISSTPPSVTYVYTGGSTYSVPFAFYGKETIKVSYSPPPTPGQLDIEPFIPMVYAIDYNVNGTLAGPHDGTEAFKYGSVTLTSAGQNKLSNGTKILVSRRTPAEQKFAYGELDNFPAKSHENALGHLTVVAQELRQDIVRTLQVPEGVADPQDVLSYLFEVAVRAEEELGYSLRIAENLNDLENKAIARNNLGLGSAATRNIGNAAGQVLTAGSATISTSHPLAGGGALGSNLTLYINSATAATATANGSSGSVVYAADNNTNARNLAATPANVAKQVDDALTAFATRTISTTAPLMGGGNLTANRTLTISPATAATQTEPGEAGSVVYAADTDYTSRDKAATPAGVSYQIIDAVFGVVSDVLRATNNLDDVADKEQARQNLQVAKIDHTHSADDITAGTLNVDRLPNINADKVTTGTFNSERLPTVPISKGGTGATSQSAARTNLGLGTAATMDVGAGEYDVVLVTQINEHGKPASQFDAVNGSGDAWNSNPNPSLKLKSSDNALAFLVGGTTNDRKAIIQSGHDNPVYADFVGQLWLNPFGGGVSINGHTALHSGNLKTGIGSDTNFPMSQAAVTAALGAAGGGLQKIRVLTSSGTYTVPSGIKKINVLLQGGGGSCSRSADYGTGGNGGAWGITGLINVTQGNQYSYTIGAGGAKASSNSAIGKAGGDTVFTVGSTAYRAKGGKGSVSSSDTIHPVALGAAPESLVVGGYGGQGVRYASQVWCGGSSFFDPGRCATGRRGAGGGSGAEGTDDHGAGGAGLILVFEYK